MAEKINELRLFDNDQGRMDRSLVETSGDVLCVSEFTLYGDCRHGRRPSYTDAASAAHARALYDALVKCLRERVELRGGKVATGQFQAMMEVESVNDGPVTLLIDSEKAF
jgi:D-aminoacyl-tRNA deacylase